MSYARAISEHSFAAGLSGFPYDVTVVMPVYNELATAKTALEEVLALHLPVQHREVVVVDDGSTDGTRRLLTETPWGPDVQIHLHDRNRGKGAAVETGLAYASGRFTAIFDADLELEISDLALVLEPLFDGRAEVVFGARRFPKGSARQLRYWIGNRGVTIAANVLFGGSLTDVMTCFKAMRTDLFQSLPLVERGFGIEPEIAAHVLQLGVPIHEVLVGYTPRAHKEGKKLTMIDGLRVIRTLLRCRFSRSERACRIDRAADEGFASS